MGAFLNDDWLLGSDLARELFHEVAEHAPIVDVHNHLSPRDIAEDRVWSNLAELWIGEDHYKWRAMRQAGFEEALVSGDADPFDKFQAWAATLPRAIGNPLYVWSHLELRRVFGISTPLSPATAREIWDEANSRLHGWSAGALLSHFRVRGAATTDDPTDSLAQHQALRSKGAVPGREPLSVVPTFRPDNAHRLLDDAAAWNAWADRLAERTGVRVADLASLLSALSISYAHFASLGGRASDHGLACLPDRPRDPAAADRIVKAARDGQAATDAERATVLLEVVALAARLARADDSVLQIHLGPLRNVSPKLLRIGRDVGGDVIGDEVQANGLARFLGDLEAADELPRTILYNLNPADNLAFSVMAAAYSRPGVRSLVQWGPAWWFNDHESGMRTQLRGLAETGMLANTIGMLTDSRAIMSMTRHELFRRLLCDELGREVEAGSFPADKAWLSEVVHDVCVANAVEFFGFPKAWAQ